MSFPAAEVLDEYRGLPGISRRPSQLSLTLSPRLKIMEFATLRVAEWDLEPPSFWDLKRPIEALMEARET